jgi:formate/nitrite transporter FocA (FNT family)
MNEETAGADSIHLDEREQTQAADHAAPQALVIHEVVREEGELELRRRNVALLWSGLAAGLSMGAAHSHLPAIGTSTLTAVLPLMVRRDIETFLSVLRMWGIVLVANLVGTIAFAFFVSPENLFSDQVRQSMVEAGRDMLDGPIAFKILKAVLAGWLIALMVWALPSARSARLFVILLLTYVVAVGRLAGSVETAFAVIAGHASVADYFLRFLLPTLLGNTIGGVALVAFLNHAPLAPELQEEVEGKERGRA